MTSDAEAASGTGENPRHSGPNDLIDTPLTETWMTFPPAGPPAPVMGDRSVGE